MGHALALLKDAITLWYYQLMSCRLLIGTLLEAEQVLLAGMMVAGKAVSSFIGAVCNGWTLRLLSSLSGNVGNCCPDPWLAGGHRAAQQKKVMASVLPFICPESYTNDLTQRVPLNKSSM